MAFYTLFVRDEETGIFHDEFGDYKKADVKEESDCTYWDRKKKDLAIINTFGTSEGVRDAAKKLNS